MSKEFNNPPEQPGSPEQYRDSPKSANIRGYYKGFSIQLTLRDENEPVYPLLDKMVQIAEYMEEKDFKSSWKSQPDTQEDEEPISKSPGVDTSEQEKLKEGIPDFCSIHNKEMKPREGQYGTFYSHARKNKNSGKWEYCKGKGFPSEK